VTRSFFGGSGGGSSILERSFGLRKPIVGGTGSKGATTPALLSTDAITALHEGDFRSAVEMPASLNKVL